MAMASPFDDVESNSNNSHLEIFVDNCCPKHEQLKEGVILKNDQEELEQNTDKYFYFFEDTDEYVVGSQERSSYKERCIILSYQNVGLLRSTVKIEWLLVL